jgi:hypothetical protein
MSDQLATFTGRNLVLFDELRAIDPSIGRVLQRVGVAVSEFDKTQIGDWANQGLSPKIEAYTLRYVLPLYELLRPLRVDTTDALVVQLFACVSWRHFDNAIDEHCSPTAAALASLRSCLRLQEYSQRLGPDSMRIALERHYEVMAEQAVIERKQAIALTDIWKRCSLLFFAGESIAQLSSDRTEVFRTYINYGGIAHDMHDLMSDAADGVKSLPVAWMNEVNPEGVFSVSAAKALFDKARHQAASLEHHAIEMQIETRFPLIHHLWMDSWRTIHHD